MSVSDELGYLCGFIEGAIQACDRILATPGDDVTATVITAVRSDIAHVQKKIQVEYNDRMERQR